METIDRIQWIHGSHSMRKNHDDLWNLYLKILTSRSHESPRRPALLLRNLIFVGLRVFHRSVLIREGLH